MRLVKHQCSLPVDNHDSPEEKNRIKRHGELLPDSIRGLIVGPSNCGKTNALMSLLIHPNGLKFQNIYVWSKSLEQPKYQRLQQIVEGIDGMNFFGFRDGEDVPSKPLPLSVFVFDDLAEACHRPVMQYFSYSRHYGVDCFYLGQTYSRIPKQLVRDNANFIVLFKQDDRNLRHAYEDHVSAGISWPKFREMAATCWKDPHGFLTIDKDGNNYRKGFDEMFKIEDAA